MTIFSIFQAFCFCTSLCFETLIFDDRLVSMFVLSRVVRFFHHIKLWANYQYNADRVFVKSAIWSGPYKVLLKSPAIILITLSEKSEIKKVRSTLINNDKLYFKGRNFRDYWFSQIFFRIFRGSWFARLRLYQGFRWNWISRLRPKELYFVVALRNAFVVLSMISVWYSFTQINERNNRWCGKEFNFETFETLAKYRAIR